MSWRAIIGIKESRASDAPVKLSERDNNQSFQTQEGSGLKCSLSDDKYLLSPLPKELGEFTPSLQELANLLGDDWPQVAANPELLANWVETVRTNRMVMAGVVPPSFCEHAFCKNCGPVLVEKGCGGELVGCHWCHWSDRD